MTESYVTRCIACDVKFSSSEDSNTQMCLYCKLSKGKDLKFYCCSLCEFEGENAEDLDLHYMDDHPPLKDARGCDI